jgi:hypothetical protein
MDNLIEYGLFGLVAGPFVVGFLYFCALAISSGWHEGKK